MKKALSQQQKELDKAEKRINELDILFRKLYEDNALGKLSDERFVFLTSGYEDEKKTLTQRITELRKEISTAAERGADVKRFIALVRRYTAIDELTYENVHEFIDRILVHELDKETNTRKIEIFYSFVGKVDSGEKPTENTCYFRQIGADVKSIRFLYKGIIIKHNKTEPTYTKTSLFLCEKRRFLWPGLRKEGNLFKLAGPGGLAFFHLTKKEVSKWPMKK